MSKTAMRHGEREHFWLRLIRDQHRSGSDPRAGRQQASGVA
jgi:hypothetical protein